MDKGEQLKQAGMEQSLLNVDWGWKMHAEEIIKRLIKNNRTITSEDVIFELEKEGARSVNYSALGSIMQRFAKEGKIKHDGSRPSKRPSRHKALIRVWRNEVYERKDY